MSLHNVCETHHEAFNDLWIQDDPNSLSNCQNSQSQATPRVVSNGKEIQLAFNPLTGTAGYIRLGGVACLQKFAVTALNELCSI